ncbi:hypothetical protein SteCoe_29809 [Stentor coeruleus]|uniref:mRNA 5'-phosphatase n=1 Tax=Stentor coeruleus TaxID=5963 RepID=A0A1R2B5B9_9CILI|nr:hypothetical protein SteCoe_29809 [Stentor coeruleus]
MESDRTILGTSYREDDRVILIAQFISKHFTNPSIEIEAKIGTFSFSSDNMFISHIREISMHRPKGCFESSLKPQMFFSLLDQLKNVCKDFTYEETKDSLYSCSGKDKKIRQTVGDNNKILATIKKSKIADKNFLLNNSGLGVRISANYEEAIDKIPERSKLKMLRRKKRHSFRYKYLEIDMTEVVMNNRKSYELEIEIADFCFVKGCVDNYIEGIDREGLINIAREIWQNLLSLSLYKPKIVDDKANEIAEFIALGD